MKLKINKEFADKFNTKQKKLEFQKLKEKYKNGEYSTESSTSESEDENAEALTDKIEKDWFCTLSAIIGKDPKIYDPNFTFFQQESENKSTVEKNNQPKSMFLKDYERNLVLKHNGILPDETIKNTSGLYSKEQHELKEEFKTFLESSDDETEDIMKKRSLTDLDKEKKEKEYIEWMKGQKEDIGDNIAKELVPLKNKWSSTDIGDEEKFLKDYVLNKRYLDDDDDRLPTYNEIVLAEADEDQFDKEEVFALKYNYRYEEPDQDFIKSYPRTMMDSVRVKDEKRAQKRQDVKNRKDQEKKKKKEELKKLKNLKKEEMLDKIRRISEVIGQKKIQLREEDLEEDFDPSKHDEVMQKLLGDTFYNDKSDLKKPTFYDQEIDDEEIDWDHYTREELQENYKNDFIENGLNGTSQNIADDFMARSRKKGKRKSKFLNVIEKSKPLFDPNGKTFEEYFDDYYNLDYEDIIADMPCRFRYRNVQPNDFGLTTDEILNAREKELNAWVSVKKMSQYRTEIEELEDLKIYKKKSKKKYKIITSLNENLSENIPKRTKLTDNKNSDVKISKNDKSDHISEYNSTIEKNLPKKRNQEEIHQSDSIKLKNKSRINNDKINFNESQGMKADIESKVYSRMNYKEQISNNLCSISNKAQSLQNNKKINLIQENKFSDQDNIHNFHGNMQKNFEVPSEEKTVLSRKQKRKRRLRIKKLEQLKNGSQTTNSQATIKNKRKRYQLSDERLAAYKIDPNKFKYFYMPMVKSKKNKPSI